MLNVSLPYLTDGSGGAQNSLALLYWVRVFVFDYLASSWNANYLCTITGIGYVFKASYSVKIVLPPFWKRIYSKRKEIAPLGSNFFPFRVDPFSEGTWCAGKQTGSFKSCLPCKTWQKISQVYQVPLKHIYFRSFCVSLWERSWWESGWGT